MADEIQIPYRDRDEPLDGGTISDLALELEVEARDVARNVMVEARLSGVETVGELLDELDGMPSAERLALVDRAREEAGLETVSARRSRIAFELRQPPQRMTDSKGRLIKCCAEASCTAMPIERGTVRAVPDRRWWCPKHRHLAGPDDHLPREQWQISARNGKLIPPPSELARLNAAEAARQARFREDQEQSRADAERLAELEAEYRASLPTPAYMRPPKTHKQRKAEEGE